MINYFFCLSLALAARLILNNFLPLSVVNEVVIFPTTIGFVIASYILGGYYFKRKNKGV